MAAMDEEQKRHEGDRPLPSFVGMFAGNSAEDDVAERADEILREELPEYLLAERDD